MGEGNNSLSFGIFGVPVTFGGDIDIKTGGGNDNVTFGGSATVHGNVVQARDIQGGITFS